MPVVVYRQPWFWAVALAVGAVLGFAVIIAASGRDRDVPNNTTIVRQPAPAPVTPVVPVPVPDNSGASAAQPAEPARPADPVTPAAPARPAEPARPAPTAAPAPAPARPAPPKVIEKTKVVVRDRVVPVPVPTPAPSTPEPAPRDASATPGGDQFRDTGLTREIRFEDTAWRATTTVTMTPEDLRSIGTAEDGSELFVTMDASPPYRNVLVAVPDQSGKYVSYQSRR